MDGNFILIMVLMATLMGLAVVAFAGRRSGRDGP